MDGPRWAPRYAPQCIAEFRREFTNNLYIRWFKALSLSQSQCIPFLLLSLVYRTYHSRRQKDKLYEGSWLYRPQKCQISSFIAIATIMYCKSLLFLLPIGGVALSWYIAIFPLPLGALSTWSILSLFGLLATGALLFLFSFETVGFVYDSLWEKACAYGVLFSNSRNKLLLIVSMDLAHENKWT